MCQCWVIQEDCVVLANSNMHQYVMDRQLVQLTCLCTHIHRYTLIVLIFLMCVMSVCQSSNRRAPHHNSGTPWMPELPVEHSMHQRSWRPIDKMQMKWLGGKHASLPHIIHIVSHRHAQMDRCAHMQVSAHTIIHTVMHKYSVLTWALTKTHIHMHTSSCVCCRLCLYMVIKLMFMETQV